MNKNGHIVCIWAGPVALACFIGSAACTGFSMPMSSSLSASEVVGFYQEHLIGIRLAAILMTFCGAFMMMFAGAISAQLQRVEGDFTPWTFVQLMGGVLGNLPFVLTAIIWTVVGFRLGRPPEITQALNDLSWFTLEIPAPTAIIQFLAIVFVTLGDKNPDPILPRWIGYANIATSILFIPGVTGGVFADWKPMDWNGVIGYLMPGLASASWILVMFAALLRANHISTAKRESLVL